MVPVSRLPDSCLKALFRQMTLFDQVTARYVCRQWNALVLEVTGKRRTLAIHINVPLRISGHTSWDGFNFDGLNEYIIRHIVSTYRAITKLHLAIFIDKDNNINKATFNMLVRLLEHWQKTLVTLDYKDGCYCSQLRPDTGRFFPFLSALSSLKYLKLSLFRKIAELPVLRQLKEIEVECWGDLGRHVGLFERFANMLAKYIKADSPLVGIRLHSQNSRMDISDFIKLNEHIRDRIIEIDYPGVHENLVSIYTHFRWLTRLRIHPYQTTIRELFSHLTKLTKLSDLKLEIDFVNILPENEEDKDRLLPQLNSVKTLILKAKMRSHEDVNQMQIAWTMPRLESINAEFYGGLFGFFHSQCTICGMASFEDKALQANLEAAKGCLRTIFSPLKRQYFKLPNITHDCETILGNVEELLADISARPSFDFSASSTITAHACVTLSQNLPAKRGTGRF